MPSPPALRAAALVSLGALLLSLIGSLFFWPERALFLDAPYIVFGILNDNALQIQEGRFGSFITQGVPLIGAKLGLPLQVILTLYSLSFPLFYLLCGLVLYRVCRRYDLVILLSGYHALLCTAGWFWTNNEVHQGVTWLLLTFGLAHRLGKGRPGAAFLVFGSGLYLALFTHPLVILPAISLWGIWLIRKDLPWTTRPWNLTATILLLGLCAWKFAASSMSGGYDSGKLGNVSNMKVIEVVRAFGAPAATTFYRNLLMLYPGFLLLLIAGIYAALRSRRMLLLFWCIMCIAGQLVLVSLTHGVFELFYIESEWMGMAIPGAALLLYAGKWDRWRPAPVTLTAIGILLVQAVLTTLQSPLFSDRILASERILAAMRSRRVYKAIIPEDGPDVNHPYLVNWDAPVQSQILSALHGDRPQRTFIFTRTKEELDQKTGLGKDSAWTCFAPRAWRRYNPGYFSIDTTATYTIIKPSANNSQ